MNKFVSKVTQGLLMALMGYEIGENTEKESIVIKLDDSVLHKTHENEANESENMNVVIILLILVLIVVLLAVIIICIMMNKRNRRRASIELREQRPMV